MTATIARQSSLRSLCHSPDFHSLYFLEIRVSRVAPIEVEIEKGCGNRLFWATTQTPPGLGSRLLSLSRHCASLRAGLITIAAPRLNSSMVTAPRLLGGAGTVSWLRSE